MPVRWMMLVIAAYCLAGNGEAVPGWRLLGPASAQASLPPPAPHGGAACGACHRPGLAAFAAGRDDCIVCHQGHGRIFDHAMATRAGERAFVARSWGRMDSQFWEKNCDGCHIRTCRDCHGEGPGVRRPTVADCQRCHNGYFTGWDYSGRAPREANMRYQRGIAVNGQTFLKMLPDVHHERGMTCGDCHSMASLVAGQKSAKGCRDCHRPSVKPVEHRIAAHVERLECAACHAAWAPQEYGTFYLRFRDRSQKEDFDLAAGRSDEYLASAYLKSQDAPPLGLNSRGRVSPIRPMYLAYYTDIMSARNNGPENVLLTAEWRAWSPHTIRRGSVGCEACHETPRRFLLEPPERRIYQLRRDGLGLDSFWSQAGQRVTNGGFLDQAAFDRMNANVPAYRRGTVEKWRTFLNRGDASSRP